MNVHPIEYEQLLAYAADKLDAAAAARVAGHLGECAACAATVRHVQLVGETVRFDAAGASPDRLVARVKRLFPRRRSDAVGGWLSRIVAELTFDSRSGQSAAFAGFRGGSTAFQLAFAGAGAEVDLQVEPPTPPATEWQLLGQVASEEDWEAVVVEVTVAGGAAVVARTTADEYGVFSLAAPVGNYDLVLSLADRVLILPSLEVG